MAKVVTLGDNPYLIPEQGNNPNESFWGENVSEWIEDASTRINAFSSLVPESSQTLANSAVNTPINFLSFSPTEYRKIMVEFSIRRDTTFESGMLTLTSDGAAWDMSLEYDGQDPTDVSLTVIGSDVVYSSGVAAGVSNIRYKASGIEA